MLLSDVWFLANGFGARYRLNFLRASLLVLSLGTGAGMAEAASPDVSAAGDAACPTIRHENVQVVGSSVHFDVRLSPPPKKPIVVSLASGEGYVLPPDWKLEIGTDGGSARAKVDLKPDYKYVAIFKLLGPTGSCFHSDAWLVDTGLKQGARLVFQGPGISCWNDANCAVTRNNDPPIPLLRSTLLTARLERLGVSASPVDLLAPLTIRAESDTCDIEEYPNKQSCAPGSTIKGFQNEVRFRFAPKSLLDFSATRTATFSVVLGDGASDSLRATLVYPVVWPRWALLISCVLGSILAAVSLTILDKSGSWRDIARSLFKAPLLLVSTVLGIVGFILQEYNVLQLKVASTGDIAGSFVLGMLLFGFGSKRLLKTFMDAAGGRSPTPVRAMPAGEKATPPPVPKPKAKVGSDTLNPVQRSPRRDE